MTIEASMSEIADSVTGFDEIAVEKFFGFDLFEATSASKATRALIFVQLRRDGATDAEAYKQAMETRTGDLDAFFAPEADEVNDSDPVTDSGKESTAKPAKPKPKPASA